MTYNDLYDCHFWYLFVPFIYFTLLPLPGCFGQDYLTPLDIFSKRGETSSGSHSQQLYLCARFVHLEEQ